MRHGNCCWAFDNNDNYQIKMDIAYFKKIKIIQKRSVAYLNNSSYYLLLYYYKPFFFLLP